MTIFQNLEKRNIWYELSAKNISLPQIREQI